MEAKVKVHGLKEVLKQLERLGMDMRDKVINEAVGKGAYILREQAQSNCYIAPAPYTVRYNGTYIELQPGSLRDSIIMKRLPKSEIGGMSAVYKITTKQIDPTNANIGKIGNIWEYKKPFMRPAVQSHGDQAIKKTSDHLVNEVQRIWRRA